MHVVCLPQCGRLMSSLSRAAFKSREKEFSLDVNTTNNLHQLQSFHMLYTKGKLKMSNVMTYASLYNDDSEMITQNFSSINYRNKFNHRMAINLYVFLKMHIVLHT